MKSNICKIIFIGMVLCFSSCKPGSYLENKDGFSIVHLQGTPYERGAAYGQILKEEIHATIARWQQEVESTFDRDFNEVIEEFFSSTSYLESIELTDADLLDEVFGMSESSKIDYQVLLAFQMSEELFTVMEADARFNCTSIGKVETDSTVSILAQNMDPPPFLHGHPIVLHLMPENGDPESLVFSVPGLLGLAGMNDKGLAITCMGISMLNHAREGLPVVSVIRNILSLSRLEEAEAFIKESSYAIPQCFGVGGPGGLRCYECSANQVSEFYPFEGSDVVLHTNHSISNRDFNQGYIELLGQYGKTIDDPYFCPRYFHAYDKIEEYRRSLDRERIETILRLPEPELESILNENTLGTLVMELGDNPRLFLATGHKEGEPFIPVSF
jgi:hypothetical protein